MYNPPGDKRMSTAILQRTFFIVRLISIQERLILLHNMVCGRFSCKTDSPKEVKAVVIFI